MAFIAAALISGIAALAGAGIAGAVSSSNADKNSRTQALINSQNVAMQEKINKQNLEHSNYWNQQNLAFARETMDAQLSQQSWANEQYIEQRDYDRALQQDIFAREDTAITRAMQDAVSAGYSPLAAVGQSANAGQVVSSSSAPGSMVSNNQASVSSAGLNAPHLEAYIRPDGLSSIGAMIATLGENVSSMMFEKEMQQARLAQEAKENGSDRLHSMIMKEMEQDWMENQENQRHLRELEKITTSQAFQREMTEITQKFQSNSQSQSQAHQSAMQEDSQEHEKFMKGYDPLIEEVGRVISKLNPSVGNWIEEQPLLVRTILNFFLK